jgi:acyl carrier protein
MERDEIRKRVEKVTAAVLKVDPKEITPTANFASDLGAWKRFEP